MALTESPIKRAEQAGSTEHPESPRNGKHVRDWHRLALGGIVLLSVLLNFFQLGTNGFGNLYYAAGVQSMLDSLHNFFFVSYDPGGFVTIDKPPVGFWLQVASAKLLGFTPFSVLLPQALAGVLSVVLLYYLVQRHFGRVAGLLAALALAVSPISVVTNRNNTIDSTLALLLLIGAWAVMRAAESGKLRYLLLCAAVIGIGFNVKMLEAYLVVPTFGLLYLVAAPHHLLKRIGHLVLAGILLLAISLSWVAAVDLTPSSQRPYVGSTQNNSELSLALGYNGIDRLLGMFGHGPAGNRGPAFPSGILGGRTNQGTPPGVTTGSGGPTAGQRNPDGLPPFAAGQSPFGAGQPPFGGRRGPGGGMFGTGTPGPLRLFQQALGGQIAWILPMAILGAIALSWQRRLRPSRNRQQQSLIVWGTWLLTMGVFFSIAGFFHPYYLTIVAPAIAALFGIGIVTMWREYRRGSWKGWLLPLALVITAGEQAYLLSGDPTWFQRIVPFLALFVGAGVVALIGARFVAGIGGLRRRIPVRAAVGLATLALLIAPTVWAGIPVIQNSAAQLPSAGPSQVRGFGGPPGGNPGNSGNASLVHYLEANQGSATYLVAVPSSQSSDSLILATNKPVMALGGFMGSDPILTSDQFAKLVARGAVHFALVSTSGPGGGQQSGVVQWIEQHGTVVPTSQWGGSTGNSPFGGRFGGNAQLYALHA